MTLVSSGVIRLNSTSEGIFKSIQYEVEDGSTYTPYLFTTAVTNSDPTIGSLPKAFSDFYGHNQVEPYGRFYASNDFGSGTFANYGGAKTAVAQASVEQLILTATSSPVNINFTKTSLGAPYVAGDFAIMDVKRRTKFTTGAWNTILGGTFDPFLAQTYSADFSTYDYLIELTTSV